MDFTLVEKRAHEFVKNSELNKVDEIGLKSFFDLPLLAVADASDPLFSALKKADVIGDRHLLPTEWLPEAKTIISYFLPFSAEVRKSNYNQGLPSIKWVYARTEGDFLNIALRKLLINLLEESGGKALAPALDSRFSILENRSNWSERHVAYIAGLGTFGLNKSLITKKGCAGRYGSVITSVYFEPVRRAYEGLYDYCTMCGECISRCPSSAITDKGKDIQTCSNYLDEIILPKYVPRFVSCGKCQTDVPCENQKPV